MKPIVFILLFFFSCSFGSVAFAQDKQPERKQSAVAEEVVVPEMYVANNRLTVKNAVGKRVEIFTILGNKVKQIEIKSLDEEHELNLPRAIYIFKLDGIVKKFVIR